MSKSAESALAELFAAAKAAQANAYAPYSRFKVGAALRTPSGAVYSGCNVENAAYPQGSCAEAGAIAAMALAGERRIAEILVIGDGEALCTPCGGCRQRIREFADPSTAIHIAGPEGVRARFTLPSFCPSLLGPITSPCDGALRVHTSRHGGFEGSLRVKFTGPMPQIAITTGSLWLRITPS